MSKECNIIKDLLPLYIEDMVSEDTASFVEEHLKGCEVCRKEYEQSKEPQPIQSESNPIPLTNLRKKLRKKKIQTIALTAVFVVALLVSAFAVLSAPIYFPYSEELMTVEPIENGNDYRNDCVRIQFSENVRNFDYSFYKESSDAEFSYCEIEAWTSLWNQWFSGDGGETSAMIFSENGEPITVVYNGNDGSESACVFGEENYTPHVALPRLSLAYYLILAVAALVISVFVWLIVRKREGLRIWVERITLYPVSYIVSHFIVTGVGSSSYSLLRDFSFIIFLSVLLYGGMLLGYNILRLKKEILEMNQ